MEGKNVITGDNSGIEHEAKRDMNPQCDEYEDGDGIWWDGKTEIIVCDESTEFPSTEQSICSEEERNAAGSGSKTTKKPTVHECPTCNRRFAQLSTLRNHQYLHSNGKTLKCPQCPVDRYFQTPGGLRTHMVCHKATKKHKCSHCGKGFHRKPQLRIHETGVHLNPRSHPCQSCGRRFSLAQSLSWHVKNSTLQTPVKCSKYCDLTFSMKCLQRVHEKGCEKPKRDTYERKLQQIKVKNQDLPLNENNVADPLPKYGGLVTYKSKLEEITAKNEGRALPQKHVKLQKYKLQTYQSKLDELKAKLPNTEEVDPEQPKSRRYKSKLKELKAKNEEMVNEREKKYVMVVEVTCTADDIMLE